MIDEKWPMKCPGFNKRPGFTVTTAAPVTDPPPTPWIGDRWICGGTALVYDGSAWVLDYSRA